MYTILPNRGIVLPFQGIFDDPLRLLNVFSQRSCWRMAPVGPGDSVYCTQSSIRWSLLSRMNPLEHRYNLYGRQEIQMSWRNAWGDAPLCAWRLPVFWDRVQRVRIEFGTAGEVLLMPIMTLIKDYLRTEGKDGGRLGTHERFVVLCSQISLHPTCNHRSDYHPGLSGQKGCIYLSIPLWLKPPGPMRICDGTHWKCCFPRHCNWIRSPTQLWKVGKIDGGRIHFRRYQGPLVSWPCSYSYASNILLIDPAFSTHIFMKKIPL